ncbi:hypothetical protein GLOIN_2v1777152 [Rhizophagus clarus]|uniref:Uncharacterized protein n=1 Tax=Rhizophagus clarus TaxID=94130 RepID=A0A8H3M0T5_9GLOM|nr:hypothetical protein GLOIN_2v1777152 [Rhizophagus clarus]
MGKQKEYQVNLVSLSHIEENFHYGPFSQDYNTRFSDFLIIDHDKMEIGKQLLKDINFHLFCWFLGKFWLFVYEIGILSSNEQLYYAGLGIKSSFYYSIRTNKD